MSERLKLLMKLFQIDNNMLAELLKVDKSLVSKWRSGVRNLGANKDYTDKLLKYILKLDSKNEYKTLKNLLKDYYEFELDISGDELFGLLGDWLFHAEEKKNKDIFGENVLINSKLAKMSTVYYWQGNKGRREAILLFTKYAAKIPGTQIISYTTESNNWFLEDPEFIKIWKKELKKYLDCGNKMRIIHPLNRDSNSLIFSMAQWLPLHIVCDVKGYYLRQYLELEPYYITILLIQGKLALLGISASKEEESKTWLIDDTIFISSFDKIATNLIHMSSSLFCRFNMYDNKNYFNDSLELYYRSIPTYASNNFGSMLPLTDRERRKFLAKSNLPMPLVDQLDIMISTINNLQKDTDIYYLVNLDVLSEWLMSQEIVSSVLSLYIGKEVKVTSFDYAEAIILHLRDIQVRKNIHVGIINNDATKFLSDLAFISGGMMYKTFVTTARSENIQVLGIHEPTISAAIYKGLESEWMNISYLFKDKNYAINLIINRINEVMDR